MDKLYKSKNESKFYGFQACQSIVQKHRENIIRVYLIKEQLKNFSELLKWCAKTKKAYHVVSKDDLKKITGSTHHEGVCFLCKNPEKKNWDHFLLELSSGALKNKAVLYLDNVGNPHNVGAIVRTAAHFNISYLLSEQKNFAKISGSLARVSEGGIEFVDLIEIPKWDIFFQEIKKYHAKIFSSSAHGKINLYKMNLQNEKGPLVFILGNEISGVAKNIKEKSDSTFFIPGSGHVGSLNVSVSSGIILSEFWKQNAES